MTTEKGFLSVRVITIIVKIYGIISCFELLLRVQIQLKHDSIKHHHSVTYTTKDLLQKPIFYLLPLFESMANPWRSGNAFTSLFG